MTKKKNKAFSIFYFIFGLIVFFPSPSYADCATSTIGFKSTGYVFYNADYDVLQVCQADGTWAAISPLNCPAGDGCIPDPCAGSPSPGDFCTDGSYYIGQVGGNDIYATAAASETTDSWNNGTFNPPWTVTGFTSTSDGPGNTAGLVALSDAGSPYDAAEYCDGLTNVHGHSDWYLPAQDELNLFWNGGTPVAGVNTGGSWYWSSTEDDSIGAWVQRFSDGTQNPLSPKSNGNLVRCVRR